MHIAGANKLNCYPGPLLLGNHRRILNKIGVKLY